MKLTESQLEKLTEPYYRGWIIHYWEELCMVAPDLSFPEKMEAFFFLVERLLREGKVRFQHPTKDEPFYWDVPPEVIVEHLKMGWPKEACSEGDEAIVDFFYTDLTRCPPIFWLGPDGEWHGS